MSYNFEVEQYYTDKMPEMIPSWVVRYCNQVQRRNSVGAGHFCGQGLYGLWLVVNDLPSFHLTTMIDFLVCITSFIESMKCWLSAQQAMLSVPCFVCFVGYVFGCWRFELILLCSMLLLRKIMCFFSFGKSWKSESATYLKACFVKLRCTTYYETSF